MIDPSVQASNIWYKREPSDYKIEWYSGTGKGGQNRNKVQCCCRLTHIPSGITKTAQTRSRENSYQAAKLELDAVLDTNATNEVQGVQNNVRQSMMGSGQRADKRRTYRFQDDSVVDHITGKRMKASKLMKGGFDLLWK